MTSNLKSDAGAVPAQAAAVAPPAILPEVAAKPQKSPVSGAETQPESIDQETAGAEDGAYWSWATAILVVGIVLRQWRLTTPPLHPDEAIHAWFSSGFGNYQYDPVYHGPLLYHLVAAAFAVFGTSDYATRVVPSLLGVILLWMVLVPMRRHLGDKGALYAAGLLAVSPTVVTYSRHLLHDQLVLCLTLGAVLCFLKSLEEPSNNYEGRAARVGLVTFLVLFLATKANVFFVVVMLAAYWIARRLGLRLWGKAEDYTRAGMHSEGSAAETAAPLLVALPTLVWFLASAASIRWPRDNTWTVPDQIADMRHFHWAVLLCGQALWIWLLSRRGLRAEAAEPVASFRNFALNTYLWAGLAGLGIYAFLFGQGVQLMVSLLTQHTMHLAQWQLAESSFHSAIPKMLDYWGSQQKKPRLPSRHDYYIVFLLLYEIPALFTGLAGLVYFSRSRSRFSDFLIWWAFTSWIAYAVANEKVPWLSVHIILPLCLLGGYWLGQIKLPRSIWIVGGTLALAYSLWGTIATNFMRGGDNAEPMFYAQTPDAFGDALHQALAVTSRDTSRQMWIDPDRQWPTVWYLRPGAPGVLGSNYNLDARARPEEYRIGVGQDSTWNVDFRRDHWTSQKVPFLIWPRASWTAFEPHRFFYWFLTRDALPADERDQPQNTWTRSILAGRGEWSEADAIVGTPGYVVKQ